MPRSYFQVVEVESQWVTLSGKPVTQLYTFEMELSSATVLFQLLLWNCSSVCFIHYRALHIAVVQGKLAIVYKLIQLLLLARRSLDIYNNLRQVKQMRFKWHSCSLKHTFMHTQLLWLLLQMQNLKVWHLRQSFLVLFLKGHPFNPQTDFFNVSVLFLTHTVWKRSQH